jgi:hypothetical protein
MLGVPKRALTHELHMVERSVVPVTAIKTI